MIPGCSTNSYILAKNQLGHAAINTNQRHPTKDMLMFLEYSSCLAVSESHHRRTDGPTFSLGINRELYGKDTV